MTVFERPISCANMEKERAFMWRMAVVCISASVVQSCVGQSSNDRIDAVIEKYDTVDFSALTNRFVHFRGKAKRSSSIYMVGRYHDSCSPYVVELDDETGNVVEIRKDLVLASCGRDFMSDGEIKRTMKAYMRYGLLVLGVDEEGNVYINPNEQEPPVLMRRSADSYPEGREIFALYRGSWYVRE